jgi:hypothetical protein
MSAVRSEFQTATLICEFALGESGTNNLLSNLQRLAQSQISELNFDPVWIRKSNKTEED